MAGLITSTKNSLFFAIFAIPGIFIFQLLQDFANQVQLYYENQGYPATEAAKPASYYRIGSLVALFFLCGIPLFKFLSDTVEDGVVEF